MEAKNLKRNRPGTKPADLFNWPIENFEEMTGLYSVQEYIQELIRNSPSDVQAIITKPTSLDVTVWKYEHLRQFTLELNLLIVQLQNTCTVESCDKMTAIDDCIYLCSEHKDNRECSAMEYMTHNLDSFAVYLNNTKNFGSRMVIDGKVTKKLDDIARRMYRLFSHTYARHPDTFFAFEMEMHLCQRFVEFVKMFDMMSSKYHVIKDEVFEHIKQAKYN